MRWKTLAAGLALGLLAAPAFAAPLAICTNTTDWGTINAPEVQDFTASFDTAGHYVHCFTFKPAIDIDGKIHANDFDVGNNQLDIDVSRIELYDGSNLVASAPKNFDFGGLTPGVTYTIAVYSDVTAASKGGPRNDAVSYKGRIESEPHVTVSQVPEPGILALLGIALLACGAAVWRRRGAAPAGEASNVA